MNIPKLFTEDEDRAVSPVIGVILMVAITVILAAVIGTFVLNLSNQTGDTAPQPSLSATDGGDNYKASIASSDAAQGEYFNQSVIEVEHEGGDRLDAASTRIVMRGEDNSILGEWKQGEWTTNLEISTGGNATWTLVLNGDSSAFSSGKYEDTEISPGDIVTIRADVGNTSTGNAPFEPTNAPSDESDVTLQFFDSDSEKKIFEADVRVS